MLLSEGKVAAVGPDAEIMQRLDLFPLTGRAEAGAIIEAEVVGHDERFGLTELRSRAGLWRLPRLDAAVGARLRLRVRARDVMIAKSAPVGPERAQRAARRGRRHRRRATGRSSRSGSTAAARR